MSAVNEPVEMPARPAAPAPRPVTAWESFPTFVRFAIWVWAWGVVVGLVAGALAALVLLSKA